MDEFDDEFSGDEFEDDSYEGDGDFEPLKGEDSSGGKKKLIAIGISVFAAAVLVIVGALMVVGGDDAGSDDEQAAMMKAEYERGLADGQSKADKAIAEKNSEIDKLTASIRENRDAASNAQHRATNSDERNEQTLKEAQTAIDKVAKERDNYKVKYYNSKEEIERLKSRIKVLEGTQGR